MKIFDPGKAAPKDAEQMHGRVQSRRTMTFFAMAAMTAMLVPGIALGQIDLSGEWAQIDHEDELPRGIGPLLGDFTGIPLNEAGRLRAETHSHSEWGLPEFQCRPHPAYYQWRAVGGVRILKEVDPVTRELAAYHIQWVRSLDRPIYMDGRPHPPAQATHSWSGFSTGRWEGDVLVVTTTHLKESYLRRNGPTASDRAVMTEYIMRDGEYLTVVVIVDDPIYLEEPLIQSVSYELDTGSTLDLFPCTIIEENATTVVPHFFPGENPYLSEFADEYGLPYEGTRGGAETLYPEYRSTIGNNTGNETN